MESPITVKNCGEAGNSYVAQTDLPMGTCVLKENAARAILINKEVLIDKDHKICHKCFRIYNIRDGYMFNSDFKNEGAILTSSIGNYTWGNGTFYCGAVCHQQAMGFGHNFIYGMKMNELIKEVEYEPLRLVASLLYSGIHPQEYLHKLQDKPSIESEESYQRGLKLLPKVVRLMIDLYKHERNFNSEEKVLEWARIWYGRVYVNSFAIRWNAYGPPLALAVYERASMFNHSCTPNAYAYFTGRILEVRLTEDIIEGTEVTISFMQYLESQPTSARREALQKNFAFQCICQRCTNNKRFQNNILEENLKTQVSAQDAHKNLQTYATKLYISPESKTSGKQTGWRFFKRAYEKFSSQYRATDPDSIWWLASLAEKAFEVSDWQTGLRICDQGLEFCATLMAEDFTQNAVQAELFFAFFKCVFSLETVPAKFFKLKKKQLKKKIKNGSLVRDLELAVEGSEQFVAALTCIFESDLDTLKAWFGDLVLVDGRFKKAFDWIKFMHSTLGTEV